MKSIFLFVLILFSTDIFSQTTPAGDSLMRNHMVQVKAALARQDYKSANEFLRKALALKKPLPDDAAYYNGAILFQQKKYAPAKSSFQKYLSLTGKSGMYYKESIEYIQKADLQICHKCGDSGFYELSDTCTDCHGGGKLKISCKSCNAKGKVLCKTCSGSGVARYGGSFGGTYQSCPACKGKGYIVCQSCLGKKDQDIFCEKCAGKGFLKTRVSCDHISSSSSDPVKLK